MVLISDVDCWIVSLQQYNLINTLIILFWDKNKTFHHLWHFALEDKMVCYWHFFFIFLNLIVSTLSILAVPHFLIGMVLISDVDCWIVSLVMLGELGNFLCDKSNSKKGVKLVHIR